MRSDEQRIIAMHKRAEQIKQKRDAFRTWGIIGVSAAACIAVIVLTGLAIPSVLKDTGTFTRDPGMSASIFASGSALGFIVIAILAFLLGVSFTVLCYRMKRSRKK